MEIKIELSPEHIEPYAVIYTNELTEEIQAFVHTLQHHRSIITAKNDNNQTFLLQPQDIYMIQTYESKVIIYTKDKSYTTTKRLYELKEYLGTKFLQINKATLINVDYMASFEAGFNGNLLLKMKNGCKDYVSRKFIKDLKDYLHL